jgi:sugar/nucleoside kinase (ribokinase family)
MEFLRKTIVAVGSALVDILAREEESFFTHTGTLKGGMTLVEQEFLENALARLSETPSIVCGGSACNTAVGVAKLGGRSRFVGKCGTDEFGKRFLQGLSDHGVEPGIFESRAPTGRVLSIITPDAERTMFTHLGASAEITPREVGPECFRDAAVVHVEGYLLFNRDLIWSVLEAARASGAMISLDLASFTVVEAARDALPDLLRLVDILIANEDEARAFTGHVDHTLAVSALAEAAPMAVLKVGERGSYISRHGKTICVKPVLGRPPVDTTGAGDLWAAGFLYGLVHGLSLEKCGDLASACGYEVCQSVGASIPEEGWHRIRKIIGK